MTARDYTAIAAILQSRLESIGNRPAGRDQRALVATLARDYATYAQTDNPRFDRGRFLAACGVPA